MTMDDRDDFYSLALIIGILGIMGILQSRILQRHDTRIDGLAADVEFLKDHTVARETEARP
jgi:hypothetical protein